MSNYQDAEEWARAQPRIPLPGASTGKMKHITVPKDAVIYWRLPFDAIPDHELGHQAFRYMPCETPPLSWWQRAWRKMTTPRHRFPHR